MRQVAILGCGPAGLLAAHAAILEGWEPVIYSRKAKSKMPGAIYLHESIPEVTGNDPEFQIHVFKWGNRDGYASKVYGNPLAPCSWDRFEDGKVNAWSLSEAYDKLWISYQDYIRPLEVDLRAIGSLINNYEVVLSSIPAQSLCGVAHTFNSQRIWIIHGKHENSGAMMIYSGDKTYDWYRYSHFGHNVAWEFAKSPPPGEIADYEIVQGIKPIRTNCDCWTKYGNYHRIGRFGRWQAGVLVHHAYHSTTEILHAL